MVFYLMYTSFTVLRGLYDKDNTEYPGGVFVFFGIVEMIQLVFQVAFLEYFRELVSINYILLLAIFEKLWNFLKGAATSIEASWEDARPSANSVPVLLQHHTMDDWHIQDAENGCQQVGTWVLRIHAVASHCQTDYALCYLFQVKLDDSFTCEMASFEVY